MLVLLHFSYIASDLPHVDWAQSTVFVDRFATSSEILVHLRNRRHYRIRFTARTTWWCHIFTSCDSLNCMKLDAGNVAIGQIHYSVAFCVRHVNGTRMVIVVLCRSDVVYERQVELVQSRRKGRLELYGMRCVDSHIVEILLHCCI